MELNQSLTSSSSSSVDPVNPDDVTFRFNHLQIHCHQPAADDDVTFGFNSRIDDNQQENDDVTFRLNPEQEEEEEDDVTSGFNRSSGEPSHQPAADDADDVTFQIHDNHDNNSNQQLQDAEDDDDVSFNVNKINYNHTNTQQEADDDDVIDDNHNKDLEDDDVDDDFTFTYAGDNIINNTDSPDADVSGDGQIRKVFPLFDQSLLLNVDSDDVKRRLPIDVPVDNVFIESPRQSPSTNGETNGTVTALPKESNTPEINNNNNNNNNNINMNMKSNSTGFSKLWRFRNNEMNRSNSDGRDAFVFLEASNATTSDGKSSGAVKGVAEKFVKKKSKKSTASAHEVYLKQKGGQSEEERKRSYLPYRPGLMGFFTNVNGGLSKNVHPF